MIEFRIGLPDDSVFDMEATQEKIADVLKAAGFMGAVVSYDYYPTDDELAEEDIPSGGPPGDDAL